MEGDVQKEAPAKKARPQFEGFSPSFKGYSQLPNEWLDEITSQIDNVAELKIVLYIYRHTWGYQEKKINPDDPAKHDEIKHITTDEFMHGRKKADGTRMDRGTGLSNRSVIDGLRSAVTHGYILETVNDRDKGRVAKSYALNIIKSTENSCEESSQGGVKNPHRGMKSSHSNREETSQRTEKRNPERNQKNERGKERHIHSFDHSSLPSVSLAQCLEAVEEFAKAYKDRDPMECRLEAEQLYRVSGLDSNAFWDVMFEVKETLGKKSRAMGVFFKRLREKLESKRG